MNVNYCDASKLKYIIYKNNNQNWSQYLIVMEFGNKAKVLC